MIDVNQITILIILCYAGYVDWKTRTIPTEIILTIYFCALFYSEVPVTERLAGFVIPALPLFFVALFNKNIKGGDIKYLSAVGAFFGLPTLATILVPTTIAAIVWSAAKKEKSVPLATVTAVGCAVYYIISYLLKGVLQC